MAREDVGIVEISAFAKYFIHGDDAERFLRHIVASPLPTAGKSLPGLMLSATGKLIGDLNVANLGASRYLVTAPTFMQAIYMRWFEQHRTGFAVTIDNASDELGAVLLVGPKSAALLDALTSHYAIGSQLAEGDVIEAAVGFAPCHIVRSDRLGDVGFEIYTPILYLYNLYKTIVSAGEEYGIRDIGIRAFSALAMEHSPGVTLREISQDHTVAECGYGHLLARDRDDFIGCGPALAALRDNPKYRLVGLRVDATNADPTGDEPVWLGDRYVGHTSSGNYGHTVGYAMALAFLEDDALADGVELEVSILGERRTARVVPTPFPRI